MSENPRCRQFNFSDRFEVSSGQTLDVKGTVINSEQGQYLVAVNADPSMQSALHENVGRIQTSVQESIQANWGEDASAKSLLYHERVGGSDSEDYVKRNLELGPDGVGDNQPVKLPDLVTQLRDWERDLSHKPEFASLPERDR